MRDYQVLSRQGLDGHARQNAQRREAAELAVAEERVHEEQLLKKLLRSHPLYDQPCPKCGRTSKFRFRRVHTRKCFACICGFQISPCAGTILHKSETPLTKWYTAAIMLLATDSKISALELSRQIGVTYKTAWRMKHLLLGHELVRNRLVKEEQPAAWYSFGAPPLGYHKSVTPVPRPGPTG